MKAPGKVDQLRDYHDLLDVLKKQTIIFIDDDEDAEEYHKFISIDGHQGPLKGGDDGYMGSTYNVLIHWEDGSRTYHPLNNTLAADMPDFLTDYAIKKNLLDEPGWKRFKRRAKNKKVAVRRAKQEVMAHKKRAPIFMFGLQVPRTHEEAVMLDEKNGNTYWQDAEYLELSQLLDYEFAKDYGPGDAKEDLGEGYKRIRCRMVYAVKHDGRHKARFVAGGHLTDDPGYSVYSSVVSIRSLRIVLLAAELNGLDVQAADVGNAYLEALTNEKIYFIAGKEFSPFGLEGHSLVLYKALYGLKSSGMEWSRTFAKTLRAEGFTPSFADPDVWMKKNEERQIWEYVCVYVDDLAIAMVDAKSFLEKLKKPTAEGGYGYKLKGDGPLSYHLGCDFFRDEDGRLMYQPKKYIAKMVEYYERTFGAKP